MLAAAALLLLAPLFEDSTGAVGLDGLKGDRFSCADIDGDGDPDLIVQGRRLFLNEKGRFVERKGALKGARGGSACIADLDGDGRKDLVTLGGDLFLQGKAGSFERRDLGFPKPQSALGIGDVDGDGRPDILTGGGELWKDDRSHLYPRMLLLNRGKGRFEDATARFGLAARRYGRSVVFCDYDDDGDQDVFFGNYRLAPNELWVSDGETLVDEAITRGGRGVGRSYRGSQECFGHTIAASWAELDGDGWMDLWVSNLVHKFVGEYKGEFDFRGEICDDSNPYRNSGPPRFRLEDRRAESGIPPMPKGDRGVYRGDELWSNCACADFDNDGDLDVFVMQVYDQPYSYAHLYRNEGGFRFANVDPGFRIFGGYGAAWADVDGDGRLDLVTGGRPGGAKAPRRVRLWRNVTDGGSWIAFRFREPVVGATVRVITETKVLARVAEATMGSFAQQNSDILHFGLGMEKIEEVRVAWPDGCLQILRRPRPGKVNVIARTSWNKRPSIRLTKTPKGYACKPSVSGAKYHWDFDDDFRTDLVTSKPQIARTEAGSICLRLFAGNKGVRARLTDDSR
jgi:hypothetical protein